MRARGCLVVAAGALLLALVFAGGAAASVHAHRRHVEVWPATTSANVQLGEHEGFYLGVGFDEPHEAVLYVQSLDTKSQILTSTTYGARFHGSLVGGRVSARFGKVGSISLRFRPGSKRRYGNVGNGCRGTRPRDEEGSFVGHVSLRGEGGYFHVAASAARGELRRSFVERCHVRHAESPPAPESLREVVEPQLGPLLLGDGSSSLATLWATAKENGRDILFRAAHEKGAAGGAEVLATALEYQGKMPVGRLAWVPGSPAGSFVTTLPGERPPTATVKSIGPFSGEAEYVGAATTSHEWTGDLAVQFPGLLQPLTGPRFASSLCVVSTLRDRYGCDYVEPNLQESEAEP